MSSGKIGVTMSIYGTVLPGASSIVSLARRTNLSKEAKKRLAWFDYYHHCGNARKTCRYFGISPQTFYRWKRRFNPYYLKSLEAKSPKPLMVRQPLTPLLVVTRIRQLREQYPRWGKEKMRILLKREGLFVFSSTIGRTITRLKAGGLLKEPLTFAQVKRAKRKRWKSRVMR